MKNIKNIKNILKHKRGAVNVLVCIGMIAILGSAALAIDVGLLFAEKNKLSNASDAGVLAGAQELPSDPVKAIDIAKQYVAMNGGDINKVQVIISDNNTKIEVNINSDVNFTFAKALGLDKANVVASAAAKIGSVTEVYDGIRPFVIEQQTLSFGQQVVLKEGAGEGDRGNYGAVALGGNGSSVYRKNVKYGYSGKLKVGDTIYTETGNMSGATIDGVEYITDRDSCTFNNYTRDSLRIFTLPVVDSLDVNGTKPVTIVGFAVFFLENADIKSGKTEITGRFIEFVTNGDFDTGQTDYGLKGVKLINSN